MSAFDARPGGVIPPSWSAPSPAVLENALRATEAAFSSKGSRGVQARLVAHYDRAGDAVGSLPSSLNPNMMHDVTPADLLAVTLSCGRLSPTLIRRILEPSPQRSVLLRALRELPDDDLAAAGANRLVAMENLHLAARDAFRYPTESQPGWDPAAVLCARKRGDLFPNPSGSVCAMLGLPPGPLVHRQIWLVYCYLLRNDEVRRNLFAISEDLDHESVEDVFPDHGVLSILDAVLGTHAK